MLQYILTQTGRLFLLLFLLSSATNLSAQIEQISDLRVNLQAKGYGDSVIIRTTPLDWNLWRATVDSGFVVVRYEITEGSEKYIQEETKTILTSDGQPFAPLSNARTLASALAPLKTGAQYTSEEQARLDEALRNGEELPSDLMKLDADSAPTLQTAEDTIMMVSMSLLMQLLQTDGEEASFVEDQQLTYTMAQSLASRSRIAADILGLRFVDYTAEAGKKYMYVFASAAYPTELVYNIDVVNEPREIPAIRDAFIIPEEGKITITVSTVINSFNGYWIERSLAGGPFELVKDYPLVPTLNDDKAKLYQQTFTVSDANGSSTREIEAKDYFFYTDNLVLGLDATYRLRGQTIFGEKSPPLLLTTRSLDLTPPPAPMIDSARFQSEEIGGIIYWDIGPPEALDDLSSFRLQSGKTVTGLFTDVAGFTDLAPSQRTATVRDGITSDEPRYYRLVATDESGNESTSDPVFLNIPDNNPPAAPTEAIYSFDSTGVLTLNWADNTDVDLEGYRVYKAYSRGDDESFLMLSQHIEKEPTRNDTFELEKTLYDSVYYQFVAEDFAGNFSERLFLAVPIPDLIPPVPPVLSNPEITKETIGINWINSSSEDVVMHRLLRQLEGDTIWTTLAEFTEDETDFVDETAEIEVLYNYTMIAIDAADNQSEYAYPFKARRYFDDELVQPTNFRGNYDKDNKQIQLSWQFQPPSIPLLEDVSYYFHMYKSVGDAPPILYKRLGSDDLQFTDTTIKDKAVYNYALKVVFENGKRSNLTPIASVKIE